ncbi:MAG TPA: Ig-like domain-containing protein, partial [Anaerolineales bacterium]|nr:Ig-like domain-containing protein [Anaerolineales bacterium]
MRVESKFISIKRKTLLYFVTAVLTLGIVTPVLADYLGPDRTTTTSEVDTYDYGVWARDNNKVPYCLDKKGNKADDCVVCEWKRKPGNACGDATYWYTLGTKSEVVETMINLPPATISSSLRNCSLNNGWCNTASELSLNGIEPLSGYNILAIEGSLNGQTFACSGSNCNVPLSEGNNDLSFWALSSYGDSSEMGTLSAKVDTMSPNVGLDVIGSNGATSWYVSPATITATGSDSTSGLSSVLLSVNGGAWTASTTLNDGVYLVEVRAEDNAGNVSTSSTTISVDTVTPSISLNVNGTMGGNGWYSSNMQVTANASDLTSGIASLEVSADSGLYQAYTSPVSFTDGYHTIQFKATDNAGNQSETPIQEFYVDTTAPAIDLPSSWEVNKTIGYNIQDDGSELAALRIVIEDEDEKYKKVTWDEEVSGDKFKGEITWNGKFRDGTVAPPGEYLVWIKAKDQAGNERFGLGRVIVPQPTVFSLFQPATTKNQETPLPPQELFDEDELPITNSSATTTPQQNLRFGESITDPKESSQTSLSLATGTSSASTTTNSNILWGATAAALIGWATATALEEKKKRKALHRASRDEAEQVKARASRDEEPSLTRQEKELAKQRKELQKIWDANGAAIYEA